MTTPLDLRYSERLTFALRALYERYGYRAYSMNRLEEYAFYMQNINFVGERIAAFADLDGRLMALKPDITLSIVKSAPAEGKGLLKAYYAETVFRASKAAGEFRELKQMGLECIGDVLPYTIAEVVSLAAQTLSVVDEDYTLCISELDYISYYFNMLGVSAAARADIRACMQAKNPHDLRRVCAAAGVKSEGFERLISLTGDVAEGLSVMSSLVQDAGMAMCVKYLTQLCKLCRDCKLRLDLSILSDSDYYNGIAFSGYVRKAPAAVLSGGQYDNLLLRMGKSKQRAIGFALYFDELERCYGTPPRPAVDVLILYDGVSDAAEVMGAAEKLRGAGKSVLVDTLPPADMRFSQTLDMRGDI